MRVTEIFASIVGEGGWMGRSAIFVRLQGCNVKCEWCDTQYSWNEGERMSVDEVMREVVSVAEQNDINKVVVTGGEPLMQKNEVKELLYFLKEADFETSIETNGTLSLGECAQYLDVVTVSPKRKLLVEQVLKEYAELGADFKFVYGFEEDLWKENDILNLAIKLGISKDRIWLIPRTIVNVIHYQAAREAWEVAVRHGWNYSDRLHIRVWSGERCR